MLSALGEDELRVLFAHVDCAAFLKLVCWALHRIAPTHTNIHIRDVVSVSRLKWALQNRNCPWKFSEWLTSGRLGVYAARNGNIEVLKWARENGMPWTIWTCAAAAKGGHLEALQWLRAKGCPWGNVACDWVANGRQLHVMNWARVNGCPWTERVADTFSLGLITATNE